MLIFLTGARLLEDDGDYAKKNEMCSCLLSTFIMTVNYLQ